MEDLAEVALLVKKWQFSPKMISLHIAYDLAGEPLEFASGDCSEEIYVTTDRVEKAFEKAWEAFLETDGAGTLDLRDEVLAKVEI